MTARLRRTRAPVDDSAVLLLVVVVFAGSSFTLLGWGAACLADLVAYPARRFIGCFLAGVKIRASITSGLFFL